MNLRNVVAAGIMAVAAFGAHAADVEEGSFSGTKSGNWIYTFVLQDATTSFSAIVTEFSSSLNFSSVKLDNSSSFYNITSLGVAGSEGFSFSGGPLSAGVHTFNFAGTGNGVVNLGWTTAAAVPEPETYAMMLAGLGAVGFMARRRKAK